jgi:hypothetical protein
VYWERRSIGEVLDLGGGVDEAATSNYEDGWGDRGEHDRAGRLYQDSAGRRRTGEQFATGTLADGNELAQIPRYDFWRGGYPV